MPFQDPKFDIVNNQIVNRATGKPIPPNVPIMIFVAKDALAARNALQPYITACIEAGLQQQADSAIERLNAFIAFEIKHPELMKMPDTSPAPAPGVVEKFGIYMHPNTSSTTGNLTAYGYDATRNSLALEFRGGKVYHYKHVPQHVYDGLIEAESKGSYASREIVGKYEGARQDEPLPA